MGKKVRCDSAAIASLTSGRGVVVGLCSAKHDSVLRLIPTPAAAPGAVASSWAALHARGLARMLPGGVWILGIYDLGRDSSVPTEHRDIIEAAALAADTATRPHASADDDPIVIVRGQAGRVVAKSVGKYRAAELRPADFRIVDMLSKQIRVVRASVPVTAATMAFMPPDDDVEAVAALTNAQSLSLDVASEALARAVLQISPDVYVVDENDSRTLSSTVKHEGTSNDNPQVLNVSVLIPVGDNIADPAGSPRVTGNTRVVRLGGTLSVCAVVLADALLGEVLLAMRSDMSLSLRSRAEILRELDEEEEGSRKGVADYAARPLPARVLANPVNSPGLPFCDYVVIDETIEHDSIPRMAEMLSWSKDEQASYNIALIEKVCKVPTSASVPRESPCPTAVGGGLSARTTANAQASSNISLACGIAMALVVAAVSVAYQLAYPARSM